MNDDVIVFIKDYFLKRVNYLAGRSLESPFDNSKISEFVRYFGNSFIHLKYQFKKLRDSGDSIKELKSNTKWNLIFDFNIAFEQCFLNYLFRNVPVEVVIVSNDKRENFNDYINKNKDTVWDLTRYLKELSLDRE